MTGRPPEGPNLADRLEGDDEQKKRYKAILETIAGTTKIEDAAASLGISPARFHVLRTRALQAGLDALAPRPLGRPPKLESPEDPRIAELEARLADSELGRRSALVREEIALTMPGLLRPDPSPRKKKTASEKVS